MTDTVKNIAVGFIIIAILFLAYKFLVVKKEEPSPAVSANSSIPGIARNENLSTNTRDASSVLQRIKNIKIDTELFYGDVFKSLEDFRVEILPVPVGRENPFAPVAQN